MPQHKKVRVESEIEIDYENISDVIKNLESIRAEYGGVCLHLDSEEAYYPRVYFVTEREETDYELERRLAAEERNKEYRREKFLRLKKEFEG